MRHSRVYQLVEFIFRFGRLFNKILINAGNQFAVVAAVIFEFPLDENARNDDSKKGRMHLSVAHPVSTVHDKLLKNRINVCCHFHAERRLLCSFRMNYFLVLFFGHNSHREP